MDGSPPGSPVPGILQASILEWVAISFSKLSFFQIKVEIKFFIDFINLNFIFILEKIFCLPKIISWISIWEILHNGKSNLIGIQETWVFTLVSQWLLFIIEQGL